MNQHSAPTAECMGILSVSSWSTSRDTRSVALAFCRQSRRTHPFRMDFAESRVRDEEAAGTALFKIVMNDGKGRRAVQNHSELIDAACGEHSVAMSEPDERIVFVPAAGWHGADHFIVVACAKTAHVECRQDVIKMVVGIDVRIHMGHL